MIDSCDPQIATWYVRPQLHGIQCLVRKMLDTFEIRHALLVSSYRYMLAIFACAGPMMV